MFENDIIFIVCTVFTGFTFIRANPDVICEVRARIDTGWLCGLRKEADNGVPYASFQGIPYAQQPLGELRFMELQPAKPWAHHLNATREGPLCPQHDEVYGPLVNPKNGMSESCIYANVYVPVKDLPRTERHNREDYIGEGPETGLPVLVYIHGGGFQVGSGDSDLNGPEYLVGNGVIIITFNYRINVFGFLSLNTTKIPGNAGLRDMLTLLRWVQRNARAFGGDPNEVTLSGQSAGAASAHLLSLSNESKGLFKRAILMSGTGFPTFFSTSPVYSNFVATLFFRALGINSTDPDIIYDRLINTPIEEILKANSIVQYETGLVSFVPVVESVHPGVTRVLDNDPTTLIRQGRGREYPLIIGFTTAECEFFKWRLEYLKILERIRVNPLTVLSLGIAFSVPPNVGLSLAEQVMRRYFHGKPTLDKYLEICRDTLFHYPAFKLSEWRAGMDGAPVYLYQFSYESEYNLVKKAFYEMYKGSAHVEDLLMIFRDNALLDPDDKAFPPETKDDFMTNWMTDIVINFIKCSTPTCQKTAAWPQVRADLLNYQDIHTPYHYINRLPNTEQKDMIRFHDRINEIARNSTVIGAR